MGESRGPGKYPGCGREKVCMEEHSYEIRGIRLTDIKQWAIV